MKKPWQIWTLFATILCIVLPAMVWLTMQINRADNLREQDRVETELARREAELQERINSALYRMDWWATPLVAQEAARPYYLYEPIFRLTEIATQNQGPKQLGAAPTPEPQTLERTSPLVYETSDFVVMHFQITEDNQITSPQACGSYALSCGVTPSQLLSNDSNFAAVPSFCSYNQILVECTELPEKDSAPGNLDISFQTVYRDPSFNRFSNPYGETQQVLEQQKRSGQNDVGTGRGGGRGGGGIGGNTKSMQQVERNMGRGNAEYAQRAQSAEQNARTQWASNKLNEWGQNSSGLIREGIMRPLWVGDKLLLARRVEGENKKLVQCCWLNWDNIQKKLKSEVADLLPEVEFEPVIDEHHLEVSRAMATLPVQLVVDYPKLLATLALDSSTPIPNSMSGLKISLWVAWIGLAIAALASAFLLKGVMQLSERRAAFVSAVTHELRTPLTTFRMYSEMLAERMVPQEKQHEYAETMKVEADRLSNLVENVLQFARLERGGGESRNEELNLQSLLERFSDRLENRVMETGMELRLQLNGHDRTLVKTDPCKVEQVVFNLVDNACKYAQRSTNKQIIVDVTQKKGRTLISVQDFGPGVSAKFKRLLFKPFCKSDQEAADTASGVGLGLALCQRMASSLGGKVYLANSDEGCRFVFEF